MESKFLFLLPPLFLTPSTVSSSSSHIPLVVHRHARTPRPLLRGLEGWFVGRIVLEFIPKIVHPVYEALTEPGEPRR